MEIILSCLHSNARFIRGKSWKISLFPKPVGEIAKTSILPTTCFKQFLCSSRLASTFGKSLSAVFVASSNSGRDVESVITAISHFSLWSKTLHCWQKLSKSTNQRVYQDLVYRNALLLKILTSVPAPLSPVPLYFSSLSLLRTALYYLNAWNRLFAVTVTQYRHSGCFLMRTVVTTTPYVTFALLERFKKCECDVWCICHSGWLKKLNLTLPR